jgi:O-methyltransferase
MHGSSIRNIIFAEGQGYFDWLVEYQKCICIWDVIISKFTFLKPIPERSLKQLRIFALLKLSCTERKGSMLGSKAPAHTPKRMIGLLNHSLFINDHIALMKKLIKHLVSRQKPNTQAESRAVDNQLLELNKYSMAGVNVLQNLHAIATDVVSRRIPGDFVECGVCNGGSAAAISLALKNENSHIWLYDSFQGMPEINEVDGKDAEKYVGLCVGSTEMVRKSMSLVGINEKNFTIREGWFEDSFKLPLPEKISILHVDCDWYDSVMLTFKTFYDKVVDGGVIIVDDFGHWEGCREAVYDFLQEKKIKPLMERFGHSQIFWVKNRTDNRIFAGNVNSNFSKRFHS